MELKEWIYFDNSNLYIFIPKGIVSGELISTVGDLISVITYQLFRNFVKLKKKSVFSLNTLIESL